MTVLEQGADPRQRWCATRLRPAADAHKNYGYAAQWWAMSLAIVGRTSGTNSSARAFTDRPAEGVALTVHSLPDPGRADARRTRSGRMEDAPPCCWCARRR